MLCYVLSSSSNNNNINNNNEKTSSSSFFSGAIHTKMMIVMNLFILYIWHSVVCQNILGLLSKRNEISHFSSICFTGETILVVSLSNESVFNKKFFFFWFPFLFFSGSNISIFFSHTHCTTVFFSKNIQCCLNKNRLSVGWLVGCKRLNNAFFASVAVSCISLNSFIIHSFIHLLTFYVCVWVYVFKRFFFLIFGTLRLLLLSIFGYHCSFCTPKNHTRMNFWNRMKNLNIVTNKS